MKPAPREIVIAQKRQRARGMRLDIAAGTAIGFEPGQTREVRLVPIAGARRIFGFQQQVMGDLRSGLAG